MGVQLRVARAAGAMHEPRRHQTVSVDLADPGLAGPRERSVLLQVGERDEQCGVMGVADFHADRAAADRPQHRHALGRREREIPASHPIGALTNPVGRTQRLAGAWMAGVEQPGQLLAVHLPGQAGGG